jgi:antitoxin MazE
MQMESKTERVELRLTSDLIGEIDAWRTQQADVPTRSEAIRRLTVRGMSQNQERQLFEIARFQIKLAAANPATAARLPLSYVYAWEWRLYPMHDDIDGISKSFEEFFNIKEDQVYELARFLDDRWLGNDPITFYQLEDHFNVRGNGRRWDRIKLISVCRYFFLLRHFDDSFWKHLLSPMEYPTEAASISSSPDEERAIFFA